MRIPLAKQRFSVTLVIAFGAADVLASTVTVNPTADALVSAATRVAQPPVAACLGGADLK